MYKYLGLVILFFAYSAFASEPLPGQIYFQPAATPVMEKIEHFHDFLMIVVTCIVAFVMGLLGYVCLKYNAKANPVPARFSHNVMIEIIWTLVPVILLIVIAIPSFRILHYAEKTPDADLTVKVVGYQWYWHYAYPDNGGFEFDSNMVADKDLKPGDRRLLEVDNRVFIPAGKVVRFVITAADVVHSFAVPSFGVKIDAVPGRINETWVKVDKPGVYYGQCSELCGVNHGFMPIAVQVVSEEEFEAWVVKQGGKMAQKVADIVTNTN